MTLRRALLILAPALLLTTAAPAGAREDTPILPGYWESTSRISLVVSSSSTERRCVRERDIDKFFSGPSNRHYTCNYPTRVVRDGRAVFEGQCRDKRGRTVDVAVSGNYTPTTFNLAGQLKPRIGGVPISPTGSITARRLSADCPPGAKGF